MQKEKVTFNELAAGALLKFGKLDSVDMTLLMYGISSIADVVKNDYEFMDEYFIMADGSIILNDSYVSKFLKVPNNILLDRMQGNVVKSYLDKLDLLEFVLRKVKLLDKTCVSDNGIGDVFSEIQVDNVNKAYSLGYIENYIQEDALSNDYQAIRLTQKGKLFLFVLDNNKEVKSFFKLLLSMGYDEVFLNKFLYAQDFSRSALEILSIENLNKFCADNVEEYSGTFRRVRIPLDK